jgi:Protein of unknown function (DUF2946)
MLVMQWARSSRRFSAWVAAVATVLMALAPAISHALQDQPSKSWIEICSTRGARWIAASADPAQSPLSPSHVVDHCPCCSLQGSAAAPPPSLLVVALLGVHFEAPRLFLAAQRTLHAWLAAQPRGPPRLS